jgi:hypothetical protein
MEDAEQKDSQIRVLGFLCVLSVKDFLLFLNLGCENCD